MKRKWNILVNIGLVCLCLCAIAVGVYSAKTGSMSIGGSVGLTVHDTNVDIVASMYGDSYSESSTEEGKVAKFGTPRLSSAPRTYDKVEVRGADKEMSLGKFYFCDMTDDDTIAPIVIKFDITNQSDFIVEAKITACSTGAKITGVQTKNIATLGTTETQKTKSLILTLKMSATNAISEDTSINITIDINKAPVIPTEYTMVEYIANTTQSYIDTGYVYKTKPVIETEIMITGTSDTDMFGTGQPSSTCFIVDYNLGATTPGVYARYGSSNYEYHKSYLTANEWGVVSYGPEWYENGIKIHTASSYNFSSNTESIKFWHCRNNYGLARYKTVRIYDNDVLVREMVPCYRNSDKVIGMYDTVGNTFYTNLGAGTFEKGENMK